MDHGSVGPIPEVQAVRGGELAAVVRVGRADGQSRSGPSIPGVDEFDRVELSGAPSVPSTYAKFVVHADTGMVSIKIIDARTDTVIREMPPDEVLKVVEELQAYLKLHVHRKG
jgi:hypothetical protein